MGQKRVWSRLVSPAPPPAQTLSWASPCLLSHPEPGSCHIRQRAQIHAWSTPKPGQGRAAGLQGKKTHRGSVPHPKPSIAHQSERRGQNHLISK